jgi:hypothetical protein
MKPFSVATVLMMLLVAATSRADDCTPLSVFRTFLERKNENMTFLAFDHLNQKWIAGRFANGAFVPDRSLLDDIGTDEPRIHFASGLPLRVFIINTNPLIYRVAQTSGKQVDSAALDSIKDFAAAFAGFVTSGVSIAAQNVVNSQARRAQQKGFSLEKSMQMRVESTQIAQTNPRLRQALSAEVHELIEVLKDSSVVPSTASEALQSEIGNLKTLIDRSGAATDSVIRYAQLVESGDREATPFAPISADLPRELDHEFGQVRDKVDYLRNKGFPCSDAIAALGAVIRTRLEGLPNDPLARRATIADWEKAVDKLVSPSCSDSDRLREAVSRLALWLSNNGFDTTLLPDEEALLFDALTVIGAYVQAATDRVDMLKKAGDLLDHSSEAITTAAVLEDANGRLAGRNGCDVVTGIIEVPRSIDTSTGLEFGKEGEETFKITADAAFSKLHLRHPTDLEKKYKVARQSWLDPDFDVALTYTPLSDPTFEAVEDPSTKTDTTPAKKFLRQTKQDTRAGQMALMLTGKITKWPATRVLAPQIGFLASTDHPGALFGGAVQLGPYIKVSAGTTWQKITKLGKDLVVGQELTGGQTVETRSTWGHRRYYALSITLDNIPFFTKPSSK